MRTQPRKGDTEWEESLPRMEKLGNDGLLPQFPEALGVSAAPFLPATCFLGTASAPLWDQPPIPRSLLTLSLMLPYSEPPSPGVATPQPVQ